MSTKDKWYILALLIHYHLAGPSSTFCRRTSACALTSDPVIDIMLEYSADSEVIYDLSMARHEAVRTCYLMKVVSAGVEQPPFHAPLSLSFLTLSFSLAESLSLSR